MITDFYEPFRFVTVENVTNSLGGNERTYVDGDTFQAAIAEGQRTYEANIADQTGMKTQFHIYHPTTIEFHQFDVVKRVADGRYYRITTNSRDKMTPPRMRNQFCIVFAEVVEV